MHDTARGDLGTWIPGHYLLPLSIAVAAAVGFAVSSLASLPVIIAVLSGIITAGVVFSVVTLLTSLRLDAATLRARVQSQAANPALEELVVVAAAIAALGAIVFVFINNVSGDQAIATAVLGIGAVLAAWFMLHMMFATRYAHLFYTGEENDLDFNQGDTAPTIVDFWYFSFTIGMTFAVSDVVVRSAAMRGVILRHAIMSYVFSALILGSTINLIASILSG
ncbi:DUF1345 domain-containing protein [Corynebacterium qintianiae]|uniref:DUF1345 domain-containing protein n=1 Tax=Corynebacterium qintianiae TaxID=2709392 RepID=UPI0013EB00D6|nr:DUF1345 domain-containing protein [Corynebacterium qintianiae]